MKIQSSLDLSGLSWLSLKPMNLHISLIVILLGLICMTPELLHSQWTTTANVVQLNNSNLERPVSITDVAANSNRGKFHVQGDPDDNFNDWLVYLYADDMYSSSGIRGAVLTIQGDRFPGGDPVLIQGLRRSITESPSFQITHMGNADFLGQLDINYEDGSLGSAIQVGGDQALWYDGDHFSWGLDANWNRIAKPVTIGSGVQPASNVGLRVDGSKDINVVGGDVTLADGGDIVFDGGNIFTKEDELQFFNNDTGVFINGENVGIGEQDPLHSLHVAGDVAITGEFMVLSDRRVKEEIDDLKDASSTLGRLRPIRYSYSYETYPELHLSERPQIGLIAQEVKEVLPEIITHHTSIQVGDEQEESPQGVNYNAIIPILIKGHQELSDRIKDLEDIVASQQELITLLKDDAQEE